MSESSSKSAPLVSIFAIFALLAVFALLVYFFYLPRSTGKFVGDGVHTDEQRVKNLAELHAKEAAQASSYAWVDQNAGVVQLPLDRAMELTIEAYAKKP
ncbi:MAG: hypothetical protein NVV63_16745 [Opitutus sp.]|nr:hypothetical protein [Opitutus sp.]